LLTFHLSNFLINNRKLSANAACSCLPVDRDCSGQYNRQKVLVGDWMLFGTITKKKMEQEETTTTTTTIGEVKIFLKRSSNNIAIIYQNLPPRPG
jgi:hypothetical protein